MIKQLVTGGLLIVIFTKIIFSQDEFFEAGYSIGGYGELHYNSIEVGSNDAVKRLDFHRFIIYYGYNWTEKWSFKSEVELEHNYVRDGQGELELEQAYVNYHTDNFGFQAGVVLPSVGLINEYHEPPLFFSVERPEYAKYIIPTTWFGNGLAFYGQFKDISWKFVLHEGLNGDGIAADISQAIRGGRQKGYKANAEELLYNTRLAYTGFPGLRLGGSYSMTKALRLEERDMPIDVSLLEIHAKYDASDIMAVFEWGNISYTNHVSNSSSGYYLDFGYNIGKIINLDGKLYPWVRVTNLNLAKGHESEAKFNFKKTMFGLIYKPINQVAFKLDYGTKKFSDKEKDSVKMLNLGVGYNF